MNPDLEKLKEVFEATLDNPDKKLYTALRIQPLVSFLGEEYAKDYTKRREEFGIHLQSLRFSDDIKTEETKQFKEIRYSSEKSPECSMVIWENNVVKISDDLDVLAWDMNPKSCKQVLKWFEKAWSDAKK